jgi:putative nucleotidyltransferase with HDIG domain
MLEENGSVELEEKETKDGVKQLIDSTYPLLKRFRDLCPGTYKHSQCISSMIEGVSMSLGLDVNKMKVCALYHDIGKMFFPKFFSENQLDDENPHNGLDPLVSYSIITRHVSDSAVILINEPNFPKDIIEIISQHHGKSVLKYFSGFSDKDGNLFRYKTCKPRCVESAVLMICDQIEATSRSKVNDGKFDPQKVIETTIGDLINDGQLDDVFMRLGDLKKVKESLAKELEGTYQKRVSYENKKEDEAIKESLNGV